MSGYRNWLGKVGFGRRGINSPAAEFDSDVVCLPVGRNLPERRSYTVTGDLSGNIGMFLSSSSSSGAAVTEQSALGVSAVLACVRLISDMVAKLPVELYRKTKKGPREITNNPGARLMARTPHELHTSFEMRKLIMTGKLLGGNGYAQVYRDPYGEPRAIQWLEPCRVSPQLIERSNGEKFVIYYVAGQAQALTRYDLIHVKGESRDGVKGISPVTLLRESIGTAMSQTEAAGAIMKNGARWPGIMKIAGNPKKEQLDQIRDEVNANFMGSVNQGRIPVVGGEVSFDPITGMNMVDLEFIESRRFELQEIARHFGIPPFLIGDSTASTTWGTGIEQQTLGFLNFCLDPHITSLEQSLDCTLLTAEEIEAGHYYRLDRDALASVSRMDTANYFTAMRNIGVYSVNDIRRKLDEPTISTADGGDNYALPLNSSAKAEPKTEPAKQPEPEPV